jgi:tetratricopeptide (TPR) repeat protein
MVVAAEQRYGRSALVRASVYEACGLYEEALSQIERLAKINPASSRAQTMLDQLRHQLGKE